MVKRIGLIGCVMVCAGWVGISVGARPAQVGSQIGVPSDPTAVGYLNLTKRHPDGNDGPTEFATAYSVSTAGERIDQLRGFLVSFRKVTDLARRSVPAAQLRDAGNTSREMQSLGFHNIPLVVEGTLLKQDYQLQQALYELARLRQLRGEGTEQQVTQARTAYAEATKRLQLFWDTKRPVD